MRKILPVFLITFLALATLAQSRYAITLTKQGHLPHIGDTITKTLLHFVNPGDSGRNVIWDFQHVVTVNPNYKLLYVLQTFDSLQFGGIESNTIYRYRISGDTLYHTGFENATTLTKYEKPELKMKFPFTYGDTIKSDFGGSVEYCQRLNYHVSGTTTTIGDGAGTLLAPDGKVYADVLRTKAIRYYSESGFDSITMQVETYSWYIKESRYPIFETLRERVWKIGFPEQTSDVASFYWRPVNMADPVPLETAPFNLPAVDAIFTDYHLLMTFDAQLLVSYNLSENAMVGYTVHNTAGELKLKVAPSQKQSGYNMDTISFTGLERGLYMVYVMVNGMVKNLQYVKIQ